MSVMELAKMAVGKYPFRCLDCRERVWVNIWLFSSDKQAACPRCLNLDVSPVDVKTMRLSLWRKLLISRGAQAYRCNHCKRSFLSFKKPGIRPITFPATADSEPIRPEMASAAGAGK
jgi:DNA-directed RNA polymerase subunit RPC12/RpoP